MTDDIRDVKPCHRRGCKHGMFSHSPVKLSSDKYSRYVCVKPDCNCGNYRFSFVERTVDAFKVMGSAARTKEFWLWWSKALPIMIAWYAFCVLPPLALIKLLEFLGAPGWSTLIASIGGTMFMIHKVAPATARKVTYLVEYRKAYLEDLDLSDKR